MTPETTDPRIAEKYFAVCHAESQLDEFLMRAFGATVFLEGSTLAGTPYLETDPDTWPCGHIVYDDYDTSFELWSIGDDGWVPTVEQLNAALDLGFSRCWLAYKDGTERYCIRGVIGEKRPSMGDRSSQAKYLRAKLQQRVEALTPYLKDGETPAECVARNRADVDSALSLLAKEKLRAESAEQRLEAAERELLHWKTCSLCGEVMTAPGHCDSAESEKVKGLEQMSDDLLDRAEAAEAVIVRLPDALRLMLTNDFIRAIGALARQQNVCRIKDGAATFVTGMEAAREYIVEHVADAIAALPSPPVSAPEEEEKP